MINSFDDQKRELFVNTLFQIIQATNAVSIHDLNDDWQKNAVAALNAIKGIDYETRSFVLHTIRALFILAIRNIRVIKGKDS